jgi:hypothetical protein
MANLGDRGPSTRCLRGRIPLEASSKPAIANEQLRGQPKNILQFRSELKSKGIFGGESDGSYLDWSGAFLIDTF